MQSWYTSKELEQLGLPALPTTGRRIREKADRESWLRRERAGRGGGFEYPIEALPAEARAELERRAAEEAGGQVAAGMPEFVRASLVAAAAVPAPQANVLCEVVGVTRRQQDKMQAKLKVVQLWRAMHASLGRRPTVSQAIFAEQYNAGKVEVPEWVRVAEPTITQASLRRWVHRLDERGEMGLAGDYRPGQGIIDRQPELRTYVLGIVAGYPSLPSAAVILQAVRAHFARRDDIAIPDLRTVQRWIRDWSTKNAQTALALANPDGWRGKHMVAFGSYSESVVRLNQLWELDSTPADVLLVDGRYTVIGVIDVYSRRAKLLVSKTSKSVAIGSLTRRALLDWGVPESMKTDNGSDYTSRHLERVIDGLGIEHLLCMPFSPHQKPHIERFFRTFSHGLFELVPGFIGHNVAERKAIESRKSFADRMMTRGEVVEIAMNAQELQAFCDKWCDLVYHQAPHDSLGGKTPFLMAVEWPHPLNRIANERVLDVLLAEAPQGDGQRTVAKSGIRVDNAVFIAPELEAFVGQAVHVRYDPADLGRIFVYDAATMAFVCVAVCPERTGHDRAEIAAEARSRQKKRIAEEVKVLKQAAKEAKAIDPIEEILRERAAEAAKVSVFPQPSLEYESDGTREAAKVVEALQAPVEAPHTPEAVARGAELIQQWQEAHEQREEPIDKYRRLYRAEECGEALAPADEAWMRMFEDRPAGRGMKMALDYEREQRAARQDQQ